MQNEAIYRAELGLARDLNGGLLDPSYPQGLIRLVVQ